MTGGSHSPAIPGHSSSPVFGFEQFVSGVFCFFETRSAGGYFRDMRAELATIGELLTYWRRNGLTGSFGGILLFACQPTMPPSRPFSYSSMKSSSTCALRRRPAREREYMAAMADLG
jgi:hypothetical protein